MSSSELSISFDVNGQARVILLLLYQSKAEVVEGKQMCKSTSVPFRVFSSLGLNCIFSAIIVVCMDRTSTRVVCLANIGPIYYT